MSKLHFPYNAQSHFKFDLGFLGAALLQKITSLKLADDNFSENSTGCDINVTAHREGSAIRLY